MTLFPREGLVLLALAASAGWSGLAAQRMGSISGKVHASGGGPAIEGARVMLLDTPFTVTTNRKGEFEFVSLVPGKYIIQASAVGYATLKAEVEVKPLETLDIQFETDPEGARLPELATTERPNLPAEFVRRSQSGGGRYLSRTDIERRAGITLGNLLRGFPGLRVDCRRYPCVIAQMRAPRNCPMAYWVDGAPADPGAVMVHPATELDGIEVYSGLSETPPELYQQGTCGAIAIWSRSPPPRVKKEKEPEARPPNAP